MKDAEIVSKFSYWFCDLIEDQCGEDDTGDISAPYCDLCEIWIAWKKSGLPIKVFRDDEPGVGE